MTQKSIKIFIDELCSKGPKKNYSTNKTDVYHIDNIWSLGISALKNYGPEKNKGDRYDLIILDSFSKFGWTIPLENKNAITKKDSFENIVFTSKRKPQLIETDGG